VPTEEPSKGCPCTSCMVRGTWSQAERDAFDEADRRSEALELSFPWKALAIFERDPADEPRPLRRAPRCAPRPALVGEVFGELRVLEAVVLVKPRGVRAQAWRCACSCGRETTIETYRLTRRGVRWCKACGQRRAAAARVGPFRSQVVEGQLVADLARRAGVSASTIWTRIGRGWTAEQLTSPRRAPFGRRQAA
jgi:hypothetical protein